MEKNQPKHICFDRIVHRDLTRPMRFLGNGPTRAIAVPSKQWVNGSTIRIRFLSGSTEQRKQVRDVAVEWTSHANLKFEFTEDTSAEIRVHFDPSDGAWSYIGTDNMTIARNEPTLNLGWVDKSVILHEFGHMIGLSHEHSSPFGGIQWNRVNVIADLSGAPNFWDEDTIQHNVFDKYSSNQINGTEFDPNSIMLYAFPGNWTTNVPGGTHENNELSELDKKFVASTVMYPGRSSPQQQVVDLDLGQPKSGAIGKPGEEDLYRFKVAKAGNYQVETHGSTDVVIKVFGPNSETRLVGQDDDSGYGVNARLRVALQPGSYYAAVRHYSRTQTGSYEIQATRRAL